MGAPKAKKPKALKASPIGIQLEIERYIESEVQRRLKELVGEDISYIKGNYMQLGRLVLYVHFSELNKLKPKDIKDAERAFASTALALNNSDNPLDVDTLVEVLKKHGTDFYELMKETDGFLDKYESEWK